MKKFHLISLSAILVLLSSCVKEQEMVPMGSTSVTVEVENPQIIPEGTKSSYTEAELNRINDLNVFVYHNGTLLKDCCKYFAPATNITIDLPSDKDGFNIYMVGNVGDKVSKAPASESEIGKFQYIASDYDQFRTKGFPIANKFINYKKSDPTHFLVKRLVGQYNITVATKSLIAEYTIRKVRMKNCALDIYPFATSPIKAEVFADRLMDNPGDYLSSEDVAKLNNGEAVDIYFLENLQGTLLPSNTDPKKKTLEGLGNDEIAKKCTYLEIVADVKTPAGAYTNGKYRYYLGSDKTTNFDIHRSTKYILRVSMVSDMVTEEGWRVEVDKPDVIGDFGLDKNTAMVMYGIEDMVFIEPKSGNHADLNYTVECDASQSTVPVSSIEFKLKEENVKGVTKKGIHITCKRPIMGRYPVSVIGSTPQPTGTVMLLIKSVDKYNGESVLVQKLPVLVYDKSFPIVFKRHPQNGYPYVYICNPFNISFAVGEYREKNTQTYPPQINPDGTIKPGTGAAVTKEGGVNFRILSNFEYQDAQGLWFKPVSSGGFHGYAVETFGDGKDMYNFNSVDWNSAIPISTKKDNKLFLYIKPVVAKTLTDNKFAGVTAQDENGISHRIEKSNNLPYAPFPRLINEFDLTPVHRESNPENYLGPCPNQYKSYGLPNVIPNTEDNVYVSMNVGGNEIASNHYQVSNFTYDGKSLTDIDLCVYSNGDVPRRYQIFYGLPTSSYTEEYKPFYIANGVATPVLLNIDNTEPPKNRDEYLRGFWTQLYGPGRDVDSTPAGPHSAEYFTKNLKQAGGNIHRWFHTKGYYYDGTYMRINNQIWWPGGSTTANGMENVNVPFK